MNNSNTHKSVFIVDDSAIVRERLISRLASVNGLNEIGQAENATAAISSLEQTTPDVIILDIQLPDGSGIDILKKIKKERAKTVVIMLTNYPYSVIRKRCEELGADFFLDKSTEFDEVIEIIKKLN
jgi:DNA-binding NarL/FixJ family response regulator